MKNKKRMLALVAALCLCVSMLPATAFAAETAERGVLTYEEHIAPQYENLGPVSEGLAAAKKNGKWGYIDTDNEVVIPFEYHSAYAFNEGLAVVSKVVVETYTGWDGKEYSYDTYEMGFVDKEGTYTPFMDDYYDYETDTEKLRVLTREWAEEDPSTPMCFHNGVVYIDCGGLGSQWNYDTNGMRISSDLVPDGPTNEGIAAGYSMGDGGVGYMDASGKQIKVWDYEDYEYFGAVTKDEWGYERQNYRYISRTLPFNQGLAPVWQCTRDVSTYEESYLLGFMDRSFQWVIKPQFTNFFVSGVYTTYQLFGETGLAMVQKDGKYGAIDKKGNTVIPFRYEELWPMGEGLILFLENGKYGYMDQAGNVIIAPQYEKATGFNNGYAVAYDGSKAFLIDKAGSAIPGADTLNSDTYFKENADGSKTTYAPSEYVVIEKNGKYGMGHIDYLPPLPEATDMSGWAYAEVSAAIEENLVPTYLQSLYLNNINRDEFCDLVVQAIEEVLDQEIEDVVLAKTGKHLDKWVREYPFQDSTNRNVIAAYALGIVNGRGTGIFDPYMTITRQEAAAFLMRSAKVLGMDTSKVENAGFADGADVGVWFKDAVNFVYQIKVMGGTGNDNFTPLGTYTREQSYMTIYRLFNAIVNK